MFLLRVTQAFEKANLPYALVGGYAVALHGAVRGTIDVDIIIALNKEAFESAENILSSLNLKPRLPLHADELFAHREEYIQEKNLIAWSFVNPDRLIESVDIIITEDVTTKHVETKKLDTQNIRILAKDDLIAMKKEAGRPQDIEDIKALESL